MTFPILFVNKIKMCHQIAAQIKSQEGARFCSTAFSCQISSLCKL